MTMHPEKATAAATNGVTAERLLDLVAETLGQVVMPRLADAEGRQCVSAILHSIARNRAGSTLAGLPQGGTTDRVEMLNAIRASQQVFGETVAGALKSYEAQTSVVLLPPSEASLTTYLRHRFPGDPAMRGTNIDLISGGNSKQTIRFDMITGDGVVWPLIMRRDRPDSFVATSVLVEFDIIKALFDEGFPVAEPLWVDDANPALPGRFMISRRVDGRQAGGPMGAHAGLEFDPIPTLAAIMARLHSLSPSIITGTDGFNEPGQAKSALIAAIDYWYLRYREEASIKSPVVDLARTWLIENADLGVQTQRIVHGDMGFHNILFKDGALTAVLDWELAHIGAAAEDLCRCREFIERIGSFDSFVDLYVAQGGERPGPRTLEYFDVFILLRNLEICAIAVGWTNSGRNSNLHELDVFEGLSHLYIDMLASQLTKIVERETA